MKKKGLKKTYMILLLFLSIIIVSLISLKPVFAETYPCEYHPADRNMDNKINNTEVASYNFCWKTPGCTTYGASISLSFNSNANFIWKSRADSSYYCNTSIPKPGLWKSGVLGTNLLLSPTNVKTDTYIDCSKVIIKWGQVIGSTSYNVYRNGIYIGNSSQSNFTDQNIISSSVYSYQVSSINATGESAKSSIAGATIPTCSATQIVSLNTGENLVHGSAYAQNNFFIATLTNPAKLIRFDPNNLSNRNTLTFPNDNIHKDAVDLVYAESKGKLYVTFTNSILTVVTEVDPITLQYRDVIVDYAQPLGQGSITTDNSYIYLITSPSGGLPSQILRYSLADFSKTNKTLAQSLTSGHSIRYDGTNVYATGLTGWLVKITNPADLSYIYNLFASGDEELLGPTDDFTFAGDKVYLGVGNYNGIEVRFNKSDLYGMQKINTTILGSNIAAEFDGNFVWFLYTGMGIGKMARLDPNTLETREYSFDTTFTGPNELKTDGTNLFITSWQNPGKVTRINIPRV